MYKYLIIVPLGMFALISLTYSIKYFNLFQNLKQDIEKSLSDLKTEYKRKFSLLHNLNIIVKNYTGFEKDTFKEVIEKRGGRMEDILKGVIKDSKDTTIGEKFKESLNINVEDYPKLKAVKEYTRLINQIEITEDRINNSRRNYNDKVIIYNKLIKTFPGNLFAGIFRFKAVDYYRVNLKR